MKQPVYFSYRMVFVASLLLIFASAGLIQAQEGAKDISLEWMYKKDQLGIQPPSRHLPHSLEWSSKGHWLSYLIAETTEAPHLAVFDPEKNKTAFLVSPVALNSAIIRLASEPNGVPIDLAETIQSVTPGAENAMRIDSYSWKKGANLIELQVKRKTYQWDLDKNLIAEPKKDKIDLPAGEKNDVFYSPNQRYAAYTRNNDLYAFDTVNKNELRLTEGGNDALLNGVMSWVYWEEFHYRRGYRAFYWSPNNDSLAYLQFEQQGVSVYPITDFSASVPKTKNMLYPKVGTKNPQVRLGVVSLSTRETHWIDLQEPYEYIINVAWHPSGKFIAIQTLNRRQNHLTLRFADPATGRSWVVLEEKSDKWVENHGGPYFLKNKEGFLWLSERTGYRHIYYYSNDGKKCKQLTKGEWEANSSLWELMLKIDEKENRVFFFGNQSSPLEKQYYSVSLNGGKVNAITHEPGTHSAVFSEDCRFALDTFDNTDVPKRIQVLDTAKGKVIKILGEITPANYAPYRVKSPEILTLKDKENNTFYASINKPFDFDPQKKYPVIVHVYAGPAGQVVQNTWGDMQDLVFINQGYIVFRFDPRGTPGRGRKWLDVIYRNLCDAPLKDLQVAVDYLKSQPFVDGNRLGIWGWSNGGYMTCCAMTKGHGLFQAGVAVAPVTDFRLYDSVYAERYMDLPENNPDGYKESSVPNFAKLLEGKLMLEQGVSDDNVHIQNIYQFVDKLIEADKNYELYVYPQRDHGIGGDDRRYYLFKRMLEFFDKNLKH